MIPCTVVPYPGHETPQHYYILYTQAVSSRNPVMKRFLLRPVCITMLPKLCDFIPTQDMRGGSYRPIKTSVQCNDLYILRTYY